MSNEPEDNEDWEFVLCPKCKAGYLVMVFKPGTPQPSDTSPLAVEDTHFFCSKCNTIIGITESPFPVSESPSN